MSDTRLIAPVEGSHFYLPSGQPYYEVEMKTKPGEYRKTTVADARKAGALPSVTTILGVLDKPALTAWKITNGILAALTLPRLDDESDDDFAKRVAADAGEVSKGAADLGTTVHNAIEEYLRTGGCPDCMAYFVNRVDAVLKEHAVVINPANIERVCVGEDYGCRIDAIADGMIIDWKTQKSYKGKNTAYPEMCAQLCANANAYGLNPITTRLVNVLVSTTDTDDNGNALVTWHEWDEQDKIEQWEIFKHCREIYRIKNGI